MAFALTDDQRLLKEAADGFFADKAPVSAFRALREAGARVDPALWAEVGAMGFAGALIDEDHGGSAMGHRALGLVLEAQGRTLAATPLLQTGLIAASAVSRFGTDAQKAEWLPKIAGGELRFALALDEGPHHRPDGFATRLTGGLVVGAKRYVPDGSGADVLIVAMQAEGGTALALVDAAGPGVSRLHLRSVDARDLADVTFDAAPTLAVLGDGALPEGGIDALLDVARAGVAAEMLGLTDACFAMTHDYLKTRTQFGRLIGSFQALQHRAAHMLVEMELTRSCVIDALDALDSGRDARAAVSLAKARAADTLHLVTNETIQMHGGIGMTEAHDAGLYIKRARVLETLYGSAGFHRDRWASLAGY